ncbi:MAG: histidinol-phosphatase [Anaerostipes sp.]|nr:histidinol-phosphatase [Anaerostipes sp.]
MGVVDIHTHMMYDVDDGSKDLEMSLDLIRMSYDAGIDTIVLTPHFGPRGNENVENTLLRQRTKELEAIARERVDKNISLYLGQELYYRENIVEKLKSGEALSINDTKYVLIEFGVGDSFSRILRAIQSLQYAGYRPIIAHVERYGAIFKKREELEQILDLGAYLQMNANCLVGGMFNREAAYCRKLLNEQKIHFIASDCHQTNWREPMTKQQIDFLKNKCNNKWLLKVLYEHPRMVLDGQYI